jgi:perosamine synthetase
LGDGFPVGRDELLARLMAQGISARRGIMAAHLEPAYAATWTPVPLPGTERLSRDSVILPLYHEMTIDDQDHVIEAFRATLGLCESMPVRRGAPPVEAVS